MKKFCFLVLGIIILFSCNSDKKETVNEEIASTQNAEQDTTAQAHVEMEAFKNIEMVEYCVLLPSTEYAEDYSDEEKAGHTFVHKTKRINTIQVQGLMRSDTNVSIEDYFGNSIKGAEEEGEVIQSKGLLKDKHCFYVTGYWSNSIDELRFIEVCWLRADDVVKYTSTFDIKDSAIWNTRLQVILESGIECK